MGINGTLSCPKNRIFLCVFMRFPTDFMYFDAFWAGLGCPRCQKPWAQAHMGRAHMGPGPGPGP